MKFRRVHYVGLSERHGAPSFLRVRGLAGLAVPVLLPSPHKGEILGLYLPPHPRQSRNMGDRLVIFRYPMPPWPSARTFDFPRHTYRGRRARKDGMLLDVEREREYAQYDAPAPWYYFLYIFTSHGDGSKCGRDRSGYSSSWRLLRTIYIGFSYRTAVPWHTSYATYVARPWLP